MKQRFLSIFLVLALIIPFFPQVTLPAKAAETTAKTQDENSNDRDHKEGSIGSITDGTRTGKKEEGNKNGFTIMDTAPVDAKGEGQKRYVAVLGYWLGGKRLELYIADKDGNRVSNTYAIGGEKTLDYLEQADAFEDTGFVSVAAGDFNGDGKDTVIAYAPLMESDSEQPQLWEFSIGSNMQLEKTGTVCNIFDILGTGNIATKHSNNGKVFRNTPVVQMTTADTDKDSVDELVVTAGMNNTKADVNNRQSRMFIYDNITEEEKSYWNKTFELDTKGYNNGNQRLRWASSSVGNLVMTGSGADYPEIITAGWVDKKTNKDADLTHDIGAYVTSCSKTTKKGNSAIGTYAKSEVPAIGSNGQPQVSGFTKDGHYRDNVQSLVVVDTFAADGVNAAASVLIMDTIYTYEAGRALIRNSVWIILITVIMELVALLLQMDWYRMQYPVIFPAMKKAKSRLYLQPARNVHLVTSISIRPTHTKRQVNLPGSVTQQDIVLVRRGMRTHLYVHQILTQTVRLQELKTYL